jgi:hypothetical protein
VLLTHDAPVTHARIVKTDNYLKVYFLPGVEISVRRYVSTPDPREHVVRVETQVSTLDRSSLFARIIPTAQARCRVPAYPLFRAESTRIDKIDRLAVGFDQRSRRTADKSERQSPPAVPHFVNKQVLTSAS